MTCAKGFKKITNYIVVLYLYIVHSGPLFFDSYIVITFCNTCIPIRNIFDVKNDKKKEIDV